MKKIVISQPMLFPWVGMFEQIFLADTFVFYDDVQFSKGSFTNRVQLKSTEGTEWMTLPLYRFKLGQKINEVAVNNEKNWQEKHIDQLRRLYEHTPYYGDMISLVESVYAIPKVSLSEISILSMEAICKYFDFHNNKQFMRSSNMGIDGSSSKRVLDVVLSLDGSTYITGHGAKKYLDHDLFEKNNVSVEYMDYQMKHYSQLNGEFTPYVSILDLIANMGRNGSDCIVSKTKYWRDFINE
jgi:hypothetical protein